MFDADRSGDIDTRELRKALQAMGMETDGQQTKEVLRKYDLSGKGKLDLVEFNRLVQEILLFQAKQEVPEWLAKFERSKANKQWNVEKADKELASLAADVVAAVK